MANKFLLVNNKFRFSACVEYHRDFISEKENRDNIKGGGWWFMDTVNKRFYCFDRSEEFGPSNKEDILNCLKNSHLSHRLEGFSFFISEKDSIKDVVEEMKNQEPDWIYKLN